MLYLWIIKRKEEGRGGRGMRRRRVVVIAM
jgi:hypothetical protein